VPKTTSRLVVELEVADLAMVEVLDAADVEADVVLGPVLAELLAAGTIAARDRSEPDCRPSRINLQRLKEERMRLLRLLAVALVLTLVIAASATAGVTKYTFTGVEFPDGNVGVIYAGVKVTNKSNLTACGYHSSDGHSLGYYADSFASDDPAAVRQFCLDSYHERQT
jgi:hypothetical protein